MERLFFWLKKEKPQGLIREEIKDIWGEIERRALEEKLGALIALRKANELSFHFLRRDSPLSNLEDEGGIIGTTEWQLFYTYLLDRLFKTDKRLPLREWQDVLEKIIDPVRQELKKQLTPVVQNEDWFNKLDNTAQMIVSCLRDRNRPFERIPWLVREFGQELARTRGE